MRFFCFAHFRWCHNGWASNILIVVDTGYAGIHHSKYWMPIHYDTIEDGQNKKSHLLFSNSKLMEFECISAKNLDIPQKFHICKKSCLTYSDNQPRKDNSPRSH